MTHPDVLDPTLVGTYPARAKCGGGDVWDAVLEYRVWCHPGDGGDDHLFAFTTHEQAAAFAARTPGAEEPLALVLQEEYVGEPEPGRFEHVKVRRLTEWRPSFLTRPRRTANTIPDFLAPDAPANRLDVLLGLAVAEGRTG